MQRAYPTDPSRSIDFDAIKDPGRGAAGGGSDKQVVTTSGTCLNITSYLCLPVQLMRNWYAYQHLFTLSDKGSACPGLARG